MRRIAIGIAVLVVCLVAPAQAATNRATDIEQRVHTTASIYCQGGDQWPYPEAGGYTFISQYRVVLHENVCAWLRQSPQVGDYYATALFTLLHELAHAGWQNANESAADCFALFVFRWEARHNFGMSRVQANALYELAWTVHLAGPAQYQGCAHLARDPLPG